MSISMSIEVANWRVLEIARDHQLYINLKNMHVHTSILFWEYIMSAEEHNGVSVMVLDFLFPISSFHFVFLNFFFPWIHFIFVVHRGSRCLLFFFFFLSYPIYHVLFSWCFWKFTICYDAKCAGYVHVGTCRISPNHKYIAYTLDLNGSEVFVLQVKDLRTGRIISNSGAEGVVSLAWTSDSNCLLYTVCDESLRPYRYFCVLFK